MLCGIVVYYKYFYIFGLLFFIIFRGGDIGVQRCLQYIIVLCDIYFVYYLNVFDDMIM